jgi:dTDP-4-dehydrorhamnose 3,5-epimerase
MFSKIETEIPGCFEIAFRLLADNRGSFVKAFHRPLFEQMELNVQVAEEFFSTSVRNVFRGMHFQVPPTDVDKLVFCVKGTVTDYVVDLRVGSPSYGKHLAFKLDSRNPKAIFIPKGLAHGFYVTSDEAIMHYKSSGIYDPKTDSGISYKGLPFEKEIVDPIISERDKSFSSLNDFENPFKF